MQHFTFVLDPVMHRTHLHFMLVLQGIQDLIPLHPTLVRLPPLAMVTMNLSSRGHSRASFACARLLLKKSMKTAMILLRSRVI
jgi:hypothetical protein